jgi:hypothetical protein
MIGLRLTFKLLGLGITLLRHETGRRLLAALVLAAFCAGLIGLLFTAPEPPDAWNEQLTGADAALTRPATSPSPATTTRPPQPPTTGQTMSAEQAARAWYARRHHLPVDRVRILQADQAGTNRIRVLVLADTGRGRLDTAIVTVTRAGSRWRVHQ